MNTIPSFLNISFARCPSLSQSTSRFIQALGLSMFLAGGVVTHSVAATPGGLPPPGGIILPDGLVKLNNPSVVDMSKLPAFNSAAQPKAPFRNFGVLRIDGTDSMGPVNPSAAIKPKVAATTPLVALPTHIFQNFDGTDSSLSSCGCQPPDTNGAVSASYDVEAVNLSLSVFNKTTNALLKRTSLNTFLNTTDSLSDPRVFFDNTWQRWVLAVIPIPASSTATPAMWLAVSQTNNPTGKWWTYRMTFGGGLYPAGTLLDYPMVGMDEDSIVISSNNFNPGYINTAVFAVSKQRAYNGKGFSFPAFGVSFSAHPAFMAGNPQRQDGSLSILAANGGGGFDLFKMTNSSRPDSTSVIFAGSTANSLWSAPNPGQQPGGGALDALDGRIQAVPYQLNGKVWFAHASGFPVVQYGNIDMTTITPNLAIAFVAGSSYDWNPSIGVSDAGGGNQYVFLQWAYTDPANGTNVSTRVAGLSPTDPVQNLIGVGTTLSTGFHGNDTRFGDFSSVSIDPSNACRAMLVQEQFNIFGNWQTHIARVGFC